MLGMSLSYKNLVYTDDELLKSEYLLPRLWEKGVRSVELRTVMPSADPSEVKRIADILWDNGFNITIHSNCFSLVNAVSDVFAPVSELLSSLRQRELILTLHPINDDNIAMLTELSNHILKNDYPVRIALENNRRMPDGTDGDCISLVLDIVKRVERDNVGICFDMGHLTWYSSNFESSTFVPPPSEFLSRVIHTHIHSYTEGSTHYPIEEWNKPLSSYINELKKTYQGIYNIELDPKRFTHRMNAYDSYIVSAEILNRNLS